MVQNDVLLYASIHTEQHCQQLLRDLRKWAEEWKKWYLIIQSLSSLE